MRKVAAGFLALVLTVTSLGFAPIGVFAEESMAVEVKEEAVQVLENVSEEADTVEEIVQEKMVSEEQESTTIEGEEEDRTGEDRTELTVTSGKISKKFEYYSSALEYMKTLGAVDIKINLKRGEYLTIKELPLEAKSIRLTSERDFSDESEGVFELSGISFGESPKITSETNLRIDECKLPDLECIGPDSVDGMNEIELKNSNIGILKADAGCMIVAFGTEENIGSFSGDAIWYSSMSDSTPSRFNIDRVDTTNGLLKVRFSRDGNGYGGEIIVKANSGLKKVEQVAPDSSEGFYLKLVSDSDGSATIVLAEDETKRICLTVMKGEETIVDNESFWGMRPLKDYFDSLTEEESKDYEFQIMPGDDLDMPNESYGKYYSINGFLLPKYAKSVNFYGNPKYDWCDSEQHVSIEVDSNPVTYPLNFYNIKGNIYARNFFKTEMDIAEVNFHGYSEESGDDLYGKFGSDISVSGHIGKLTFENCGPLHIYSELKVDELEQGPHSYMECCAYGNYDYDEYEHRYGMGNVVTENISVSDGHVFYISWRTKYNGNTVAQYGDTILKAGSAIFSAYNTDVEAYDMSYGEDEYELELDKISSPGYLSYRLGIKKTYEWKLKYTDTDSDKEELFYRPADVLSRIEELDNPERDYMIDLEPLTSEKRMQVIDSPNTELKAGSLTFDCKSGMSIRFSDWLCPGEKDYFYPPITMVNNSHFMVNDSHLSKLDIVNSNLYLSEGYNGSANNLIKELNADKDSTITISNTSSIGKLSLGEGAAITFDTDPDSVYDEHTRLTVDDLSVPDNTLHVLFSRPERFAAGDEFLVIKKGCDNVVVDNAGYLKNTMNLAVEQNLEDGVLTLTMTDAEPPFEFTVKFDGNGSTNGSVKSINGTSDSAVVMPANGFARSGYDFKGWSLAKEGPIDFEAGQSVSAGSFGVTKESPTVTVYAVWGKREHNDSNYYVVFHNGSETASAMQRISFTKSTALKANSFKKDGYAFIGWAVSQERAEEGIVDYKNKAKVLSPATEYKDGKYVLDLYAVWADSASAIFNLNGGAVDEDFYEQAGYILPVETEGDVQIVGFSFFRNYTLPTPVKFGYRFGGWYQDGRFKKKGSITKKTFADKELFARWIPNKYKVIYHTNVPEGVRARESVKKQSMTYGKNTPLKKNSFRIKGYTFTGWALDDRTTVLYRDESDGLDDIVMPGSSSGRFADINVYACWSKDTYTIAYYGCEDINEDTSEWTASYQVDSEKIVLPTPTKEGYTFAGWYKDERFRSKARDIKKGSTGDIKLYAKWRQAR